MKNAMYLLIFTGLFFQSCTDNRKVNYTVGKSIPLESTFQETDYLNFITVSRDNMRNLFNVPIDATVESFTLNGFSLEVIPELLSPADLIDYQISIAYGDDPNYYYDLIDEKNLPAGYGTSINIVNNLSKKVKGDVMKGLSCTLGSMIGAKNSTGCSHDPIIKFRIDYLAKLNNQTPAVFSGTVKGNISAQIIYTQCESLPKGIFSNDLEKCD